MEILNISEIEHVSGAISNDTGYAVSLGSAGGFLAMGLAGAAMLTPLGMGVMLGASIFSSGMAIRYALN